MKSDQDKTKEQLISELEETRQRVAGLETVSTDGEQAKTPWRESEERFRCVFEAGAVGIAILTLEGKLLQSNRELQNMLGYSNEELRNMSYTDVTHPDEVEEEEALVKELIDGKRESIQKEKRYVTKDGHIIWGRLTASIAKDEDGRPLFGIGITENITERKRAEETIKNRLELMKLASEISGNFISMPLHQINDGINSTLKRIAQVSDANRSSLFLISDDLTTVTNTHEWCNDPKDSQITLLQGIPLSSFGYHEKQLRDHETISISSISDYPPEAKGELAWIKDHGFRSILFVPLLREEKLCGAVGLYSEVGKETNWPEFFVEFIKVIGDIFTSTLERKQVGERARELEQQAQISSRLATVGEMAAGIAHEINNPLTGVVGFSDLLLKKDLPEDMRKDVNIINEGAKRIASITSRMLTFARQHKPERTSVNINDIIEVTLAMRAYEMKSSNIKVTTQLASDIPLTFADAGQLQQVFLNIILNAEMEMNLAHGKGNLKVKTERIDNSIRVSFKDDGPGIPKKNLDKIFDPFFTTRDPDKGTGLGLSICYTVVTQHDGKIYAQSRLGKGATFFVELPIVTKKEQLKMAKPAAEVSKTLPKARMLVVDDDTIVQQFLTKVLHEEGHELDIVDNGNDAMEKLSKEDYDVILLDIKLPGMNGIELYEQLQKSSKFITSKVIFITGDMMSVDTTVFINSTGRPCLTKPFDAEQLKKEINRILTEV